MTGRKILVLCLTGMLTLGMGSLSAAAEEAVPGNETAAMSEEEAAPDKETAAVSEEEAVSGKETAAVSEEEAAPDNETAEEDGIAGVYMISEESLDDMDTGEEDSEMLQAIGGTLHLILREDGTGAMEAMGQEQELEWNEKEIILDGSGAPYSYKEGVLTVGKGSSAMTFRKLTGKELENAGTEPLKPGDYDKDTRAGYYKLSTIEDNGEVTNAQALSAIGQEVYLVLKEDNTGQLFLFDRAIDLTWNDKSITYSGEESEYSYDAGTIILKEKDVVLTLVYAGKPDEAPDPAAVEEAEEETAKE